jgi:hypothetical protein
MFQYEYAVIEVADALAVAAGTTPIDPVVRAIAGAAGRYAVRATREEYGDDHTATIVELRIKSIESLAQLRDHINSAIADLKSRPTST